MVATKRQGKRAKQASVPSPLKYPGGKYYQLPFLRRLTPTRSSYDTLVEGCTGGSCYTLDHDCTSKAEVVNDLDGQLTTFYRVLQDERLFQMFKRRLEVTPFSQVEWEAAWATLLLDRQFPRENPFDPNEDEAKAVDIAVAYFIRCRQSVMGMGDGFAALTTGRLRRGMNEQASAWLSSVDGLAAVHARLRRVVILNEDVCNLLRRLDKKRVLFMLDPPYLPETRNCKVLYANEMSFEQHEVLLKAVVGVQNAMVMICGYDSELYRTVLEGAGWHRHENQTVNHMSSGSQKAAALEVVWTNYSVPSEEQLKELTVPR